MGDAIRAGLISRFGRKGTAGEKKSLFDAWTIVRSLGSSHEQSFNVYSGAIATDFLREFEHSPQAFVRLHGFRSEVTSGADAISQEK
jgi:hypothetical protein